MAFAEYDAHDGLGLAALVREGEVTARELLEEAIARAERVNPRLNAIVIAMHAEARRRVRERSSEGPFAGVPFLLKDLVSGYAGVPLQSGSRLYRGYVPNHHAELVRRYEQAGVVVFGKTNTPELGILPTTEPELYGRAHNPWRHGVTPGGSSGGSAAAVAAGIVPMAHGGDGGGSIRIPAGCCGLFGLKPTRNRNPVGPDASEAFFGFAVEHVLTRSVRDSAAMLDATAGPELTSMFFPPPGGSFLRALDRPPDTLRIAFSAEPLLPAEPDVNATRAVEEAAALCEALGHHVERARPMVDGHVFAKGVFLHFAAATAAELAWAEERFLRRPVGPADVERTTWLAALVGRSIDAGQLAYHRRLLFEQARSVLRFFRDHDVLLTPTTGAAPLTHGALDAQGWEAQLQGLVAVAGTPALMRIPGLVDGAVDRAYAFAPYTPVFNVTGQPSASVPLFWTDDGLPLGAMFTGRMGDEGRILRLAAQLEEARPWFHRRPPTRA
ncbi:MAG TPA: amidase [Sandaracinaceae bacterium LLY-WYZ-13_1]|nr:amidase [Sandaracinaceae bacterium LLY-WYZ-13_1]